MVRLIRLPGNSIAFAAQATLDTVGTTAERFLVKNFGCRASQADGAAIEAGLAAKGLASSADVQDADLVVLNTCTVTATADDEVRQVVRRIHREKPSARILITGCYAQGATQELAALEGEPGSGQ